MFATRKAVRLVRGFSRRRVRDHMFDNWYNHCPKCGSLLVSRMGLEGPEYHCLCGAAATRRPEEIDTSHVERDQGSEIRDQLASALYLAAAIVPSMGLDAWA
jgi:hypothetical protein